MAVDGESGYPEGGSGRKAVLFMQMGVALHEVYHILTKLGVGYLLRVLRAWWACPREEAGPKTGEKKHACVELL